MAAFGRLPGDTRSGDKVIMPGVWASPSFHIKRNYLREKSGFQQPLLRSPGKFPSTETLRLRSLRLWARVLKIHLSLGVRKLLRSKGVLFFPFCEKLLDFPLAFDFFFDGLIDQLSVQGCPESEASSFGADFFLEKRCEEAGLQ